MSRTLSPETASLIASLYQRSAFWERPLRRRLAALARIGHSREPAAIPNIAPLLLDSRRKIAIATATAAGELFGELSPGDLP